MPIIFKETKSFFKLSSLPIETISEKWRRTAKLYSRNIVTKMISCAPLLESQTVVTELKWMNTVFFLLLLFVYTAICNYMVEQI